MNTWLVVLLIVCMIGLAIVIYLLVQVMETVKKLVIELESLTDNVEKVQHAVERHEKALTEMRTQRTQSVDPIAQVLGLLAGNGNAKWLPLVTVAIRGFTSYLGSRSTNVNRKAKKDVRPIKGSVSQSKQLEGKKDE